MSIIYVYGSVFTTVSFVLRSIWIDRLVMHLNDIPMDCRRENLRLGDHMENNQSGMYAFTSPVAIVVL